MSGSSNAGATSTDIPRAATTEGSFARFWRCALQVNPYTYQKQYRGTDHGYDEAGFNQALAQKCNDLKIDVVGIADHGNVDAIENLRSTLNDHGILVFPGFEITSTEKLHMVCLFHEETTPTTLNKYLGALGLETAADGTRPSTLGCLEIAKRIDEWGGLWYAAHLTIRNGLLRLGQKDGGGLTHIWKCSELVRIAQITRPTDNEPENIQSILRNQDPSYKRERPITLIHAKDVAVPEDLADPTASTFVKMTRPTFDAFKVAFLDPESRVRLQLSDTPHSAITSVRISGGYLDGLNAHLSDHLNALIGGRGSGKSTLLECIRYALELQPKGKQAPKLHQDILRENLGKASGTIELVVRSTAHHGATFSISRRWGEPPIVRDAAGIISQQRPKDLLPNVEIYGQNEIFELSQDGPSRVRLLERFLPDDHGGTQLRAMLRKKLAENAALLAKALNDKEDNATFVARLPKLQEQLEGFKQLGIESKLARVPLYARERQLVERIDEELSNLNRATAALKDNLPDLTFLSEKAIGELPSAESFVGMRKGLETLVTEVDRAHQILVRAIDVASSDLGSARREWNHAVAAGESELEAALAGLPDLAGKSGREVGTAYKKLSQEIERIHPLRAKEASYSDLVAALTAERKAMLADLSSLRRARAAQLQSAVDQLNKRLKGKIRIELGIETDRNALMRFLIDCKLENVSEKRLAFLNDQDVTPLALAAAIEGGAEAVMTQFSVSTMVANALAKAPTSKLLEMESIELEDQVHIELNVAHGDQENFRELSRLSTGQQCTAILHLLLLDNADPLIVDQPEDNLDNAFIAERIVRELRDSKTMRQFLFSTHNANIPVFGDAEWIGVLVADESHSVMGPSQQGSIDVPGIRKQAAEILEGGPHAFKQRKEMYGF